MQRAVIGGVAALLMVGVGLVLANRSKSGTGYTRAAAASHYFGRASRSCGKRASLWSRASNTA